MNLSLGESEELNAMRRSRTIEVGLVRRARLVLMLDAGATRQAIMNELRCDSRFVSTWRTRFIEDRLSGLYARHPGRAPRHDLARLEARVLKYTLQHKPKDGSTHWSSRKLAAQLGLPFMTVQRIWRKHDVRPHRLERHMVSNDPEFEAKTTDVIGLYLNPPTHAVVFCVDEKTAIQALDRKDRMLPQHQQVRRTVSLRLLQLELHLPSGVEMYPLVRQGRAGDAAAQLFAPFAVVGFDAPMKLMLHDWGAVYGYQYAMHHPRRVAGIVGIDIGDTASGEFLRGLGLRAKLGIVAYQGWLALAYALPRALGDRMTRWMARTFRAPGAPQRIGATMNYPYVAQFTGGFKGAQRVKPACPMLFVYGTRKPFMFHAEAWAARIAVTPGSVVQALPAGHWVMVNRREEFHRAVDTWLGV